MGVMMLRFGRRGNNEANTGNGVERYEKAGKEAKKGLAMIMEAIDENNLEAAKEGMEMAWEGVKQMCDISKEMKQQYGERRYNNRDGMNGRDGMNSRGEDWNERDDEWMERRMRDSRGRYM